jgi:polyhydroxybutyrate depolymerase
MAHRLACEQAVPIAAAVTLAGVLRADLDQCQPSRPVSIAHIHGTKDETIRYEGGQLRQAVPMVDRPYPGALATVRRWAEIDGCDPSPTQDATPWDLDNGVAGTETRVQRFSGCKKQSAVELWTLEGGSHAPLVAEEYRTRIFQFYDAHPMAD